MCFHLSALLWWNFGAISIPSSPETVDGDWMHLGQKRIVAGVDAVDRGRHVRTLLEGWLRVSGTFQLWRMFSPDAPDRSGFIAIYGIEGYDAAGRPIVDPVPFRTTDNEDLGDRLLHIPKPPCGWNEPDDPRTHYFVRSYALFRLREHIAETGADYVGVRYTCQASKLPEEDEREPTPLYEIVFWEGTP